MKETKKRKQKRKKQRKKNRNTDIAYQNKDITSKLLAENFGGKSFRVYGLNIPEVKAVLPTNIPSVRANELRLDNLFELADGTAALVDYESEYKKEDKVKYLNYLTGIANRFAFFSGEGRTERKNTAKRKTGSANPGQEPAALCPGRDTDLYGQID